MQYRIFGKTIVANALCKIMEKQAKEKTPLTTGAVYCVENIRDNKIILYELSPQLVSEIKEIENLQEYKIVPYQSCIIHTFKRKNFVFLEESIIEKENEEGEKVKQKGYIITAIFENYISFPTQQTKEEWETGKENLFQQFRSMIREEVKEFEIVEGTPKWDTPAEFLLPELLAYRRKQEQSKEIIISKVLNALFIVVGILFFSSTYMEYQNLKKEHLQIAGEFGQLEKIKEEIETSKYLDTIAEQDKTEKVVALIQQTIGKIRQIPQATLTDIEYKIETGQLVVGVDIPSFAIYQKIKDVFKDQAQVNVSYASKISCKIIYNLAGQGEINETETTPH